MISRKPCLLGMVLTVALVVTGCSSTAPAPTAVPASPTKAPVAAAAPTAAAVPTVAPAKAVDFPQKGKAITIIVPWAAGGGVDLGSRLLAPGLEKELGVPVQVVNKAGAGSQTGIAEFVSSRPDGYTLAATSLPATNGLYLDAQRKATFSRKDFLPVAHHMLDPMVMVVKSDSKYKTAKDVLDAAKAAPEQVKVSTTGVMGSAHMGVLQVEKLSGVKFAAVHFEGFSPSLTALLGGHIDVQFGYAGEFLSQVKGGQVRILGIASKARSKFYPDVPVLEEQGLKLEWASSRGYAAPAGTPKEVVDIIGQASKKVMESDDHRKKLEEMGQELRYLDSRAYDSYWTEVDAIVKPLLDGNR